MTVHRGTSGTAAVVVDGNAGCSAVAFDAIDDASGAPAELFPPGTDPLILWGRDRSRRKEKQALLAVGGILGDPTSWKGSVVAWNQSQGQYSLGVWPEGDWGHGGSAAVGNDGEGGGSTLLGANQG